MKKPIIMLLIISTLSMLLISCSRSEENAPSLSPDSNASQESSFSQEPSSASSLASESQNSHEVSIPSKDATHSSVPPQSIPEEPIISQSAPISEKPPHRPDKLVIASDKITYALDDKITVTISNNDACTYLYRPVYHLQQLQNDNWVTLERAVKRMSESAVWLVLLSGEAIDCNFDLYTGEYVNVEPGRYRFFVEGTLGKDTPNSGQPYTEDASGMAIPILAFTTEFDIV